MAAAARTGVYVRWIPAPIFVSTNAGASWAQTSAPSNNWSSVACSADGIKLVAVSTPFNSGPGFGDGLIGAGLIYTSPDSGATWTSASAPSNNWTSVASSADGAKLVAVAALHIASPSSDGLVYTSNNSGATWTRTGAPGTEWVAVASSADGQRLVAADGIYGLLCTYPYSGPWRLAVSAPNPSFRRWKSVASSADGTKLAVTEEFGPISTSSNSGTTWTQTSAPSQNWVSVSSSANGTKLVAVVAYSSWWRGDAQPCIYTSTDSGANWVRFDSPAVKDWSGVASSADGSHIVAVGGDSIHILQSPAPAPPLPPSPQLAVGLSGAALGLSWLVPSSRFILNKTPNWDPQTGWMCRRLQRSISRICTIE